ncbi:PLP-dependent aminotransferase family protein, partial [Spirillospora sp. NPDC049652]
MTDLHLGLDRSAGHLAAQLAAECRNAIRAGRLAAGTRLPSSRDLARDLGVSRGVVVTAYEQLIAEGFLVARRGDGTRVAPNALPVSRPVPPPAPPSRPAGPARAAEPEDRRTAAAARPEPVAHTGRTSACLLNGVAPRPEDGDDRPPSLSPPPPVRFDLTPGRPDLSAFPRSRWLAAYRAALQAVPHQALTYPDARGVPELRAELAAYLGRVRAAHADAGQVVIMNGVALGLSSAVRALVATGRTTLAVEDPTSDRQLPMLAATGARIVRVPVDAGGLDVAALARSGASAVLVTPAHQYPTGVVL